jgi:hypothetical protein
VKLKPGLHVLIPGLTEGLEPHSLVPVLEEDVDAAGECCDARHDLAERRCGCCVIGFGSVIRVVYVDLRSMIEIK